MSLDVEVARVLAEQLVAEGTDSQRPKSPRDQYLELHKNIDPNCIPALAEIRADHPMKNPFLLIEMVKENNELLEKARRQYEKLAGKGDRIDEVERIWMNEVGYLFRPDKGAIRDAESRRKAWTTSVTLHPERGRVGQR